MNEFKSFDQIPQLPREPVKPLINRDKIQLYRLKPKETVVGSEDINWKPIDQVAARVVAPAPWYCEPPQPEPKMSKNIGKVPVHMSKVPVQFDIAPPGIPRNEQADKAKNEEELTRKIGQKIPVKFAENVEDSERLVERAKEATAAIEYLTTHIKQSWIDFDDWVKKAISLTRQNKIAMDIETRALMADFREIRAFFLDERHLEEVSRLEKFVSLCRELKELKQSGFIDAVADTILKL